MKPMLKYIVIWCILDVSVFGGVAMSIEEKLLQDFLALPEDKKLEVIDFVEFLKSRNQNKLEALMDNIIVENRDALEELAK